MPIKPENKSKYPPHWKRIRTVVLRRANNRCELCGIPNHINVSRARKTIRIVLSIAHLDHHPENCKPSNLRALCLQCHISLDKKDAARLRKSHRAHAYLFPER